MPAAAPAAQTLAFIGLGVMGYPMAGHLARAGHRLSVYNRTADKAAQWVAEHGGRCAATAREAAAGAQLVFCCVGDDESLRSLTLGADGAFAGMAPQSVLVDHTTASAQVARELHAAAAAQQLHFMDAPVSGGQAGAQAGQLAVMCGGDAATFARVQPLVRAYAKVCTHIGPSGSGQLAKMVNQLAIAGLLQGLSEALAFGQKAGLDMQKVLATISQGAAQSWQMDHRSATMLQGRFDFGFAVRWMRKDLALALDEARRNGAALPVSALVEQFYAEVQAMGGAGFDTSSLIARLTR